MRLQQHLLLVGLLGFVATVSRINWHALSQTGVDGSVAGVILAVFVANTVVWGIAWGFGVLVRQIWRALADIIADAGLSGQTSSDWRSRP